MSTTTPSLMTVEEFLALPDDGVDRELIRGQVVERGMTVRNKDHSEINMLVGSVLLGWAKEQHGRWRVVGGEAGFLLARDPDLIVGINVAVVPNEVMKRSSGETSLIEGAPLLAVEVLSPSDTHGAVHEKVDLYLANGVEAVGIVDPDDRTIKVYRPGQPPELFNDQQYLACEDVLPGFSAPVAELFPVE